MKGILGQNYYGILCSKRSFTRGPYEMRGYNIPLVGMLPIAIHNTKGDVLIWWTSGEIEENRVLVSWLLDDLVRRCFGLINKIRIKYVEL